MASGNDEMTTGILAPLFSGVNRNALCLACSREYQNATEAFGLANLDNEAQRRMFRERRNRTQEKIESFLPFVMEYRSQKNNR